MYLIKVPEALFKEFGKKYGMGEPFDIGTRGRHFLMQKVNPETAGFEGAIGLRGDCGSQPCFVFAIWGMMPRGTDDIFEPRPSLEITAMAEPQGMWMIGRGRQMKEECKAEFGYYGLHLQTKALDLIVKALKRAGTLTKKANAEPFWEKDIHPEWDFTRSPG